MDREFLSLSPWAISVYWEHCSPVSNSMKVDQVIVLLEIRVSRRKKQNFLVLAWKKNIYWNLEQLVEKLFCYTIEILMRHCLLLQKINYPGHHWQLCGDIKVVSMVLAQQNGFTNFPFFICEWDSRSTLVQKTTTRYHNTQRTCLILIRMSFKFKIVDHYTLNSALWNNLLDPSLNMVNALNICEKNLPIYQKPNRRKGFLLGMIFVNSYCNFKAR